MARYNHCATKRHWKGLVHILRYLDNTRDLGILYPADPTLKLEVFADAGYLSDRVNGRSQTGFVLTINGAAFDWKSRKQGLTATSTTYAELIAAYDAAREMSWISKVYHNVAGEIDLPNQLPIPLYEDNNAAISLIKSGLVVTDATKHIEPKFHYVHELIESGLLQIVRVDTEENPADLFTKILAALKHWQHVHRIGMRRLSELGHLTPWSDAT